jgi:hypothetical protein
MPLLLSKEYAIGFFIFFKERKRENMATRMRGTTASCSHTHTHTQTDRHGIQVKQLLLLWLVHPLAKFYLKEIPNRKKKKKDE